MAAKKKTVDQIVQPTPMPSVSDIEAGFALVMSELDKFDLKKHQYLYLGIGGVTFLTAGQSAVFTTQPQLPINPTNFYIPKSIAQFFDLDDLKIGKNSILLSSSPIPAEICSNLAGLPIYDGGSLRVGQQVTVAVTYKGPTINKDSLFTDYHCEVEAAYDRSRAALNNLIREEAALWALRAKWLSPKKLAAMQQKKSYRKYAEKSREISLAMSALKCPTAEKYSGYDTMQPIRFLSALVGKPLHP